MYIVMENVLFTGNMTCQKAADFFVHLCVSELQICNKV